VERADELTGPIDIGLAKVCPAMWTLGIKYMDEFPNTQHGQSFLSGSQFFDFSFGDGLEDVFFATAKLEGMHGRKGKGLLLKKECLVFRLIFFNFHLLLPIP
jgi:hypothetical protein